MRELVKSQPVVILPIGSVEDHGPVCSQMDIGT